MADPGFIAAMAHTVRAAYEKARAHGIPRMLFSAHGLPEKIVKAGDPYQFQCEYTAAAVVGELGIAGLDWMLCYQSRVGPLQWLGPPTDEEIERAGRNQGSDSLSSLDCLRVRARGNFGRDSIFSTAILP